ncbi:hypothetical protein GTO89_15995 [Heliobacterium gestii]|uniref:Uncharacterized protein n=1 Tax=Heliomicrobium gestii TaxID=2699 RepID=A0A845LGJ5_HELGE|nr:hypothetical protein [Heliomicrobium gestii]MBM7868412.1 hypothetical protein [Heliomicrobium gestii]MZP44534.1 hypothetical protein [Heliomicrobium gestii]
MMAYVLIVILLFQQETRNAIKLNSFLTELGITNIPPYKEYFMSYNIRLVVASSEHMALLKQLEKWNMKYTYAYEFEFSEDEMNNAPLYRLRSIVQLPENKLPDKYGTIYKKECLCSYCGLSESIQQTELHFDTSIMKKRHFINQTATVTSGSFTIVSEAFANIMEKKKLSGYTLRPVHHVGSMAKRREVFQLILNNQLPPLSSAMRFEKMTKEYCAHCNITGRIFWPLHYDYESIIHSKDFNQSKEMVTIGNTIIDVMVVSSQFREICKAVKIDRSMVFEPVIVVN